MNESSQTAQGDTNRHKSPAISGHLARRLTFAPIRVLAIVSGFALLRGIGALVGRFLLTLRRRGTATVEGGTLRLTVEWSILGRVFRTDHRVSPIASVDAARFENRKRYVYLLVGFGFLAVGTWVGIQWLVDGLRAGYPLLALVGAAIVAGGIGIDLLLYLLVPEGKGSSRITLAMGPWFIRLAGVDREEGEAFVEAVRTAWKTPGEHN